MNREEKIILYTHNAEMSTQKRVHFYMWPANTVTIIGKDGGWGLKFSSPLVLGVLVGDLGRLLLETWADCRGEESWGIRRRGLHSHHCCWLFCCCWPRRYAQFQACHMQQNAHHEIVQSYLIWPILETQSFERLTSSNSEPQLYGPYGIGITEMSVEVKQYVCNGSSQ